MEEINRICGIWENLADFVILEENPTPKPKSIVWHRRRYGWMKIIAYPSGGVKYL